MELDYIHLGDCLTWLKTLPAESVDAVVTDPPYSSGGAFRGDRMGSTKSKYQQSERQHLYQDFTGDNRDQRSFGYWCTLWLGEAMRVTKPGGVLCCFTDWRQLPTTTDAVQAGGWVWRGVWVWDKTEGVRPQLGRFRAQCEYVVWGSKGAMPLDRGIQVLPGLCREPVNAKDKQHIAGKPVAVLAELLRIVPPGGIVLDPFAGSGTTLLAAKRSGRRYLGCEMVPHYHGIAVKRLEQSDGAADQGGLFARLDRTA